MITGGLLVIPAELGQRGAEQMVHLRTAAKVKRRTGGQGFRVVVWWCGFSCCHRFSWRILASFFPDTNLAVFIVKGTQDHAMKNLLGTKQLRNR